MKNCDRCSWYPKGQQLPAVRSGRVADYVVRKTSGTIRQALCPDHVAALRAAGIGVSPV